MARPKRYTVEQVITAIKEGKTVVGTAAVLGCTTETIRNYAKRYPVIAGAIDSEREDLTDIAEMKLRLALHDGAPWAIQLTLRTQGKKRGWNAGVEVTGGDGQPLIPESRVTEEALIRQHANLLAALGEASRSGGGASPETSG